MTDRRHGTKTWARGCLGKVGYSSKRQASGRMRLMRRSAHTRTPDLLNVYHCSACGRWHLGNLRDGRPPTAPLRRMKAADGDVVEIAWRHADGTETRQRYVSPSQPLEVPLDVEVNRLIEEEGA